MPLHRIALDTRGQSLPSPSPFHFSLSLTPLFLPLRLFCVFFRSQFQILINELYKKMKIWSNGSNSLFFNFFFFFGSPFIYQKINKGVIWIENGAGYYGIRTALYFGTFWFGRCTSPDVIGWDTVGRCVVYRMKNNSYNSKNKTIYKRLFFYFLTLCS